MAIVIDACVAQHQGDRAEQQDRVSLVAHPRIAGCALAVLADGMGGHTGGALAAEQVLHTARYSFEHFAPADESPRAMLGACLQETHAMIKASRFINEKDPHSTAVMLLLQPGKMTWVHCGDSRLYRFRGRQLLNRTVDHSYVEHLLATGKISPAQALTHSHRNVLVTSLGGEDAPRLEFAETEDLRAGDSYLLCSDGLWAYFEDGELATLLAENTARQACEALIDMARQRAQGTGDNLSLAVIKLLAPPEAVKRPAGFVAPMHV